MRNPLDKEEATYKQGRVDAMCFVLLLVEDELKAGSRWGGRHIKILAAAMIHALETQSTSSLSLWEHMCDVMYPPKQHKEETALCRYVASCTMGDAFCTFHIRDILRDDTVTQLGHFLTADVADSVTKWAEREKVRRKKEVTTLLELGLWKSKMMTDGLNPVVREECRLCCGARVIIPSVLPFL